MVHYDGVDGDDSLKVKPWPSHEHGTGSKQQIEQSLGGAPSGPHTRLAPDEGISKPK